MVCLCGDRLLLTGGEYSTGDYKKAFVDTSKGDNGYSGQKVHVAMTFPGDLEGYYITTLNQTSVLPWANTRDTNNVTSIRFIKRRNKELCKVIKAVGDASRLLSKFVVPHENGNQEATQIFSIVFWQIFTHCRDYKHLVYGGDGDNSESDDGVAQAGAPLQMA